jgi:uncharacterized membrane protein YhhN
MTARTQSVVLTAIAAVSIAAWLPLRHAWGAGRALPVLLVASACYLLIALRRGAQHSRFGRLVLIALGLCCLGDCFGPRNFVLGLGFFLVAHIALMAAFVVHGLQASRLPASLAIALAFGIVVFFWLYPHVPPAQHLPIFAYMLVITAMVTLAGGARPDHTGRLILLGAVIFYASDLFLARSTFVARGFINTALGYPLYYAACILFAFSVATRGSSAAASEQSEPGAQTTGIPPK